MNIDEAAEEYANADWFLGYETDIAIAFKDDALSDVAKQYWFEQLKAEQKQPDLIQQVFVDRLIERIKELEQKQLSNEDELKSPT